MNIAERINEFIEYGNKLRGAEVYFREDWRCYYFSLMGKCFGMLTEERITLKGNPIENIVLRNECVDIKEGYYTNKKHWNSIITKTTLISTEKIKEYILKSYELVLNGLTKKEKLIIEEMSQKDF